MYGAFFLLALCLGYQVCYILRVLACYTGCYRFAGSTTFSFFIWASLDSYFSCSHSLVLLFYSLCHVVVVVVVDICVRLYWVHGYLFCLDCLLLSSLLLYFTTLLEEENYIASGYLPKEEEILIQVRT